MTTFGILFRACATFTALGVFFLWGGLMTRGCIHERLHRACAAPAITSLTIAAVLWVLTAIAFIWSR